MRLEREHVVPVVDQHLLSEKIPAILAGQRQGNLTFHPERYNIHYLTAYLGAVIGDLSQRGMVIHAVKLSPSPQSLGCSITFDPPSQPIGFSAPAWVAYNANWDECRGWSCQLHHITKVRSRVRRYLGEPIVPAPEAVADFIAGLSRVQTLVACGTPIDKKLSMPRRLRWW